jgi:hypothetical protein
MSNNHGYETPTEGTLDWHVPLNDNFETLDRDVEIRAPEGNRGDYEPKAGAKFFATDTGAVYVGDGTAWNQVGAVPDVEIHVGAEKPTDASEGDVWIDTS